MARLACIAGAFVVLLGGIAAEAGPDEARAGGAISSVPTGSFESAGIAVFVRAHEARRGAVSIGASSPAYVPVATAVVIGNLPATEPVDLAVPGTTGSTAP